MSAKMGTTLKTTMTPSVKLGRTAGGGVAVAKTTTGRVKPTAALSAGTTTPYMGTMPPLHGACHKGSSKEVKKLIALGEDVNEQTKSGMTPLMCAVKVLGPKDGDDGIVAYLIENKANVNLQDIMGDTALHIACCSKDPSNPLLPKGFDNLTQVLIDRNADVNICNKIGQTAIHRASLRGNNSMAKQLIEAKADLEQIDRCGRTALDIAFDQAMRDLLTAPPPEPEEAEGE